MGRNKRWVNKNIRKIKDGSINHINTGEIEKKDEHHPDSPLKLPGTNALSFKWEKGYYPSQWDLGVKKIITWLKQFRGKLSVLIFSSCYHPIQEPFNYIA